MGSPPCADGYRACASNGSTSSRDRIREGDEIFRTYFTGGRGVETLGTVWTFLDLTPLGRQEDWEDSPDGYPQTPRYEWWRRHDEYEPGAPPASHLA